jgi:aerobic carbon-monoxide dehydrogenase small subunit
VNDPTVREVRFPVNGRPHVLPVGPLPAAVDPAHTLAHTLRHTLGLTGTKVSCDRGACGCCTVLVGAAPMLSCMMLTVECDGLSITTVEGLADPVTGALDPLQQSFIDHTAFQCGYCTPGILMSTKALLLRDPSPALRDIQEALAGNYCRCISHYHVLEAVTDAIGAVVDVRAGVDAGAGVAPRIGASPAAGTGAGVAPTVGGAA